MARNAILVSWKNHIKMKNICHQYCCISKSSQHSRFNLRAHINPVPEFTRNTRESLIAKYLFIFFSEKGFNYFMIYIYTSHDCEQYNFIHVLARMEWQKWSKLARLISLHFIDTVVNIMPLCWLGRKRKLHVTGNQEVYIHIQLRLHLGT